MAGCWRFYSANHFFTAYQRKRAYHRKFRRLVLDPRDTLILDRMRALILEVGDDFWKWGTANANAKRLGFVSEDRTTFRSRSFRYYRALLLQRDPIIRDHRLAARARLIAAGIKVPPEPKNPDFSFQRFRPTFR